MQLKRRDQVVLYGTTSGQFGSLVDYSGHARHSKHATVSVKSSQHIDYVIPVGYKSQGVAVPSSILQRILIIYLCRARTRVCVHKRIQEPEQTDHSNGQ